MQITPINNFNFNYNQPSFGVNLQSSKLKFKHDDFYVHIKGFGKNYHWVEKIQETADRAVAYMRDHLQFEAVLKYITGGVYEANQYPNEYLKQIHTGILRAERKDWKHESDWDANFLITHYDGKHSKYRIYKDRFDRVVYKPLKNPFDSFMLTRPVHNKDEGKYLNHAEAKYVNHSLDMVRDLYNKLHENYIEKEAFESNMDDINSTIAEIRWILAHSTPWERGSDAISNTFIRAIYKAIGVKTYPLKRGVSLDLEAYCTNLDEYKKNFASYFAKKPELVN